ncbi:hypothetical protein [Leptospira wolffii]|uniref:hypothetical protein n=1 Tax=Leptospira wolffii TaxID=409998 RepID=UPI0012EC257B|nr:hypothetical protein [Leptospira wolffii]
MNLEEIIIQFEVFSGSKNSYSILFPKTKRNGEAILDKIDFVEQFNSHFEIGLMDYNGTIETANPIVEVSLFNPKRIKNQKDQIMALPLTSYERKYWKNAKERYDYLISCRNNKFKADLIKVNIEETKLINFGIGRRFFA